MNTFKVVSGGYQCGHRLISTREPSLPPLTEQNGYALLFVTEGECGVVVNEYVQTLSRGSLWLLRPEDRFTLCEGSVEAYYIIFPRQALPSSIGELLSRYGEQPFALYPKERLPQSVSSPFLRLETARTLPEDKVALYLGTLVSEVLILLACREAETLPRKDGELGARVVRYLNENIEKNLSLDDLAKRFFVSKYYLCRAFKRYNGSSIHGYLTKKRILYAKSLIQAGESASSAAYRVGFGDYSAFYRAYVKLTGASPTLGKKEEGMHGLSDFE